jgi:hypothetical protein
MPRLSFQSTVVTLCTKCFNTKSPVLSPQSVFLCFNRLSESMLIITGSSINQLTTAMLTQCGYCNAGAKI